MTRLRSGLRAWCPPILWDAVQQRRTGRRRTRLALNGLDDELADVLPTGPGYFVELGANDGLRQSNTYWLEAERAWRGLLIEPALNRFFELCENRAPDNDFVCAACVPFSYTEEFVRMDYADLMSTAKTLASDLEDVESHLRTGESFLASSQMRTEYGAVARPLQAVLDEVRAPAIIDFLSLDVEGAEMAVLQGLDHDRTRFRFALIECRDSRAIGQYLDDRGYRLLRQLSVHDFLFEHREG